ncbi:hypothetical protein FHT78_001319 [Rhizobium sp. BK196]|nr:hypothetical protein [Rhizobium sp. BK196]
MNDAIIVHQYQRVVVVDFGDGVDKFIGEIESLAFPIAVWKVLPATHDWAVGFDNSGTCHAYQWRLQEMLFLHIVNQFDQHIDQFRDRRFAALAIAPVSPKMRLPDAGFR